MRASIESLERRARLLSGGHATRVQWAELLREVFECARVLREAASSNDHSISLANAKVRESALSQLAVVIEEELAKLDHS